MMMNSTSLDEEATTTAPPSAAEPNAALLDENSDAPPEAEEEAAAAETCSTGVEDDAGAYADAERVDVDASPSSAPPSAVDDEEAAPLESLKIEVGQGTETSNDQQKCSTTTTASSPPSNSKTLPYSTINNSNDVVDNADHQISPAATDEKRIIEQTAEEDESVGDSNSPQHSPTSLRRSTRVSALKAQKRLKEGQEQPGTMVQEQFACDNENMDVTSDATCQEASAERQQASPTALKKKLKRRLENGENLDQYDCKFGIRLDGQDVVMMSEGSEISSLSEEDISDLRLKYENLQKKEPSSEVKAEREYQIKELEAALRIEETKLVMLKKIRLNQQQALIKKQQAQLKQLHNTSTAVGNNTSGQAYKPAVVAPPSHQSTNSKLNGIGTSGKQSKGQKGGAANVSSSAATAQAASQQISFATLPPQHQKIIQVLAGNNSQQLCQLLKNLNPQTASALTELLRQYQQQQHSSTASTAQQQHQQQAQTSVVNNTPTLAAAQQSNAAAKAREAAALQAATENAIKTASEFTQQKITAARMQMRRELEQQMMKLPPPKAPVPDMYFIPNGNQPDFCYLLGLDLTVQRVLKDKNVFRKMNFLPYQCEECETDFTTSWKAICDDKEEYHLYCENCVRHAQKRKVRQDYTQLLKRAFQQVQQKEEEFEKQVTAGKYTVEPVIPPIVAAAAAQQQASVSTVNVVGAPLTQKTAAQQNLGQQNQLNHSIASMTGHGGTKPTTSIPNASQNISSHSKNSATANITQTTALNFTKSALSASGSSGNSNQQQNPMMNVGAQKAKRVSSSNTHQNTPSNTGSANNSSTNSSSNAMNSLLSNLANSPTLQQQLALMMVNPLFMRQMQLNPMVANVLSNPVLLQMMMQMMAQQNRQNLPHQQVISNSNSNGNAAMAALQQAVQQSSVQHKQSSTSGGGPSNIGANTSPMAAAMAALTNQISGGSNSNNENMLRQIQAYMAHLKTPGGVGGKKG